MRERERARKKERQKQSKREPGREKEDLGSMKIKAAGVRKERKAQALFFFPILPHTPSKYSRTHIEKL